MNADVDDVDVEAATFELYGLKPADFTAARAAAVARARRKKDTAAAAAIGGLRKPTLAVWAVNLLARTHPDQAEALLRLGAELRRSYRELDGERMRALSQEQHRVIGALAVEAGQLAAGAGEQLRETVLREVGEIFHGLLADEEAARRWASGCLAKAPAVAVGFEGLEPAPGAAPPPADPAGASAARNEETGSRRAGRAAEKRRARTAAVREQAAEASAALQRAEELLAEATAARDRAEDDAAGLSDELAALRQRAEAARREAQEAKQLHRQAEQAHAGAVRAAEKAARRLEDLERSEGPSGTVSGRGSSDKG
ncbi:hypothetical protein OG444_38635 [Streptomyces sp. NBC_01232]|uniref:hypothetical protein n=1 Tax=Streptomyces sp. NBC_01232 TaxID=2903786 RepID=UPI002E118D60|nr:hypothetical protein OG444_38635 [Streptomyces sp. NBC_01232]